MSARSIMVINTVHTPFGTFTRESRTAYNFAAVCEAAQNPEDGLRVVGNRKGEFTRPVSYAYGDGNRTYDEPRVRYHIVWSRTKNGAQKNAEGYVWAKARVVGVFTVASGEAVRS